MNWGDVGSYVFLNYVAPVLTAIIMALVGLVLQALRKKYHFQALKFLDERIEKAAYTLILAEENKAAEKIKQSGNALTGGEKWARVIGSLLTEFPTVDPAKIGAITNAVIMATPGVGPKDLQTRCDNGRDGTRPTVAIEAPAQRTDGGSGGAIAPQPAPDPRAFGDGAQNG
jgi:hypothetical protein